MANSGVDGRLRIIVGTPEGFTAEVHGLGWWSDTLLGTGVTDAGGNYSVRYGARSAGGQDLQVRVYDHVHRLIVESDVLPKVTDPVVHVDLGVSGGTAHGWIARLGFLCTDGNQVELLIDNEDAWGRLTDEVTLAAETVALSQLHFEVYSDLPNLIPALDMFTQFSPDPPLLHVPTTGTKLQERMKAAAGNGLRVRLLLNDFLLLPFPADTAVRNRRYFKDTGVEVATFERWLNEGPMHAKSCTIDGQIYYSIGSPLMQEYFDGRQHRIDDRRRGTMSPPWNAIQVPIHDVSVRVTGPHATVAAGAYEALWTKDSNLLPLPPLLSTGAPNPVQLVATVPGNTFAGLPEGETGIIDAYQRALANAEDFVYLENQYFTEPAIADAIIGAMRARPLLRVIMALNPKIDVPRYAAWQTALIDRVITELGAAKDRIGFFSLWSHEVAEGKSRIIRNYIHSKVAVADAAWATIGSANLDGVSLTTSQFVLWDPNGPWKDRNRVKRAVEINAVFYNAVDGLSISAVPDDLRRSLWAEHLGYPAPGHPDLANRPADGWLGLWRRTAARKLAGLNTDPPTVDAARVLEGPFGRRELTELGLNAEEEFLVRAGVALDRIEKLGVQEKVRSFDFETGRWDD